MHQKYHENPTFNRDTIKMQQQLQQVKLHGTWQCQLSAPTVGVWANIHVVVVVVAAYY